MPLASKLRRARQIAAGLRPSSLLRLRQLRGVPILIGGCGRSGTTLLSSILSTHPHIAVASEESRAFIARWKLGERDTRVRIGRVYRGLITHEIQATATRWCEKTPRNILVVPKILDYFAGRVKILQIVRDGRDVVSSVHPKHPELYHVDPERWVNDVTVGLEAAKLPQVFTFRYEDLVQRYRETMDAVMRFLDEDPTLLGSYPFDATVQSHKAWWEKARPISASSIGRWREPRFAARVAELLARPGARDLLAHYGYPAE
jgi:hypothetical protein